jgi:integrase
VDILAAILSALFIAAFGWTCSDFRNPAMPRVTMELSGVGNCAEYRGPVPKTGISEAPPLTLLRSAGTMATQHTFDHLHCPACDAARVEAITPEALANVPFQQAAATWLTQHSQYVEPRTVRDYRQYIKSLTVHFGLMQLKDVHIGHIRVYQRSRQTKAGNSRINMECSTLQQILKEANLWHAIAPLYRPLPTRKEGAGKPYTPEERSLLLKTALGKNRRWHLAGHCLNIMFNTGVGFGELRALRRSDFDLEQRTIWVLVGAKNPDRRRRIPLNDEAFRSMVWILERWEEAGGTNSDEFMLFHRAHVLGSKPDFSQHMDSIKTAYSALKKKTGIKGRRIYDCRATFITEILSSGKVSLNTAEKLVGHVGRPMQKRYYKPEMDLLRSATDSLNAKLEPKKEQGVVRIQLGTWISTTNFG